MRIISINGVEAHTRKVGQVWICATAAANGTPIRGTGRTIDVAELAAKETSDLYKRNQEKIDRKR